MAGHDVVVCEVTADPPNPASDALHATLGFANVGVASIHGGSKTVRYLALSITSKRHEPQGYSTHVTAGLG